MLVPHGAQVMVIDGGRLAVFQNKGRDITPKLELIEQEREIGPRSSEIGSDQPGRSFQSGNGHRAAYEQTDYHQLMEDRFVAQASTKLEALLANEDAATILIASPRVLGTMRKQLKPKSHKKLLAEISKDYAGLTAEEVSAKLAKLEP